MKQLNDVDFMEFVGKLESQYLVSLSDYHSEIKERFSGEVNDYGDPMPWEKTHNLFRMRPQEVTIWAGINGHGKSMVTSHVVASLLKHTTCLIASLEMPIAATGRRMIRQMVGTDSPSEAYIDKALKWTDDKLWIYDQLDSIETERIFGMCVYAMKELKIKHIVIDSLMKCGINDDDYNGQKVFVDRLCWAAKTYGSHIHLIHHIRKTKSEEDIPDKFDVMGASALTNLVDNVILVHRNKAKENKAEEDRDEKKEPDARLVIAKQRHGEWEGKISLWFDKQSNQYLPWSGANKEWFSLEANSCDKAEDVAVDQNRHVPEFDGDALWKL